MATNKKPVDITFYPKPASAQWVVPEATLTVTQPPDISYHEYRVMTRIMQKLDGELGDRLRALVAFGDLLTRGNTFDIDLLAIVEGWEGRKFAHFTASPDLPMRGELRLYLLTPEVVLNPQTIPDEDERVWVENVVKRVRLGYEVILESPFEWTKNILAQPSPAHSTLNPPPSGSMTLTDLDQLLGKSVR